MNSSMGFLQKFLLEVLQEFVVGLFINFCCNSSRKFCWCSFRNFSGIFTKNTFGDFYENLFRYLPNSFSRHSFCNDSRSFSGRALLFKVHHYQKKPRSSYTAVARFSCGCLMTRDFLQKFLLIILQDFFRNFQICIQIFLGDFPLTLEVLREFIQEFI